LFLFFVFHGALLVLHSFPTRRSSDLPVFFIIALSSCEKKRCVGCKLRVEFMIEEKLVIILLVIIGLVIVITAIRLQTQFIKSSRSEEHTSELQSRENLVCRLLLEKKK